MSQKSELFAEWTNQLQDDPEYIAHGLLADLTDLICQEMQAQGITRRELAVRLGVSPQYVTKFLNTPSNTTLLQVVRFAHALGLELRSPVVVPTSRRRTAAPLQQPTKPARRAAAAPG